jgi:Stage II sporulation protein E (SpoIIE)
MDRSHEQFFLPTKDGGGLLVVVSVRMMRQSERSRFAVVTLTDISEQKRTEGELRVANARLESVDADATLYTELESGDRVVMYTDGLTDVLDSRGEMLRVEGRQNFVRETALLPFNKMKQSILYWILPGAMGHAAR